MFRPSLITPPASQPVALADLKAQIPGLSFDDDDAALTALLSAAVGHFDGYSGTLGRCIVSQTWRQQFSAWGGALTLPFPDVSSVVVKYTDADGVEQTVSSDEYELVSQHGGDAVVFKGAFSFPAVNADTVAPIWVDLTAGFSTVPDELKNAIIIVARSWYDGDEELPDAVQYLTMPLRVMRA